ncbi:hypothetical protein B0H67DRAFT_594020 [Lasiosphaeris hirsuta]|uniref:Transmembrane protein n=1 Tax=Lasiosphaeris hirsuta TaxID=260670 RepID=A0AA39ZXE6_9PEZI|nr:hypothetical protein B0H67DRAFT_594020 [Lasiosphaeris hirsuta]
MFFKTGGYLMGLAGTHCWRGSGIRHGLVGKGKGASNFEVPQLMSMGVLRPGMRRTKNGIQKGVEGKGVLFCMVICDLLLFIAAVISLPSF